MLDLIDEVLEVLEPGGVVDPASDLRTADSGTTVDHTAAPPFGYEFGPDRLYAWLIRDRHEAWEAGNPPSERERFELNLLYVADSEGEQAAQRRFRSVSEALDAKAHAYLAAVAANKARTGAWADLGGEVSSEPLRGFNVRGVGLRLTGWRYL